MADDDRTRLVNDTTGDQFELEPIPPGALSSFVAALASAAPGSAFRIDAPGLQIELRVVAVRKTE